MYQNNEPSALFHSIHHAHRRRVTEAQLAQGLGTLGSPMLLLTLFRAENQGHSCSQRELAGAMRLSPATVAVSPRSLERDGYVCRRSDKRDARRNIVELTDKGRWAVEACGRVFRSVDEKMLEGFSPEEREQLSQFLQRMLDNLGGRMECRPPLPGERDGKECDC